METWQLCLLLLAIIESPKLSDHDRSGLFWWILSIGVVAYFF
jgi:hypothetical protein